MANRYRGEIDAELDGKRYRLVLTLGALAELESRFGVKSLAELVARMSGGSMSATEMAAVLGAGLRAGGTDLDDTEVANMYADGGLPGIVAIVTRLLGATFGQTE